MAATADVIVIGGGIMGASIAFHLARRKAGRVLVLEKRFLGAGSTGKSGAIIRQHYSHPLTTTMARRGLEFFSRFPDLVGGPEVFTPAGMAIVVAETDRDRLEANVAMQQQVGVNVEIISAGELRDIDPETHIAPDEVVAYEREAGYVEALPAVAALVEAAAHDGAELREGVEVTAIRSSDSAVTGVETSDGPIESKTSGRSAPRKPTPLSTPTITPRVRTKRFCMNAGGRCSSESRPWPALPAAAATRHCIASHPIGIPFSIGCPVPTAFTAPSASAATALSSRPRSASS
jgi:hypothetical protein